MNRLIVMLVVALVAGTKLAAGSIETTEASEGVLFTEDGAKVLFYQRAPKSFDAGYTRNNYVHPLWDLRGNVLTQDAPADHLHQRGIYWTWHQTLVGATRLGDAWECRDFIWDVVDTKVEDAVRSAKRFDAVGAMRQIMHLVR